MEDAASASTKRLSLCIGLVPALSATLEDTAMRPVYGGIDFGTSNSTVGIIENGRPRPVPLEQDDVTLPSAVFFNYEDNGIYLGRKAIGQYTDAVEGRLMRALKSVLGSSLVHEKTRLKSRSVAFTDIIGIFLGHLKQRLESHAGEAVDTIVLGRPVQFVDDDADADAAAEAELEKAARAQGFRHIAFQFEPIAAALDYEQDVTREELALIVDMGGGTSDFSIVRVSPERAKASERKDDILANSGIHIGGTDFDRLLSLAHVMPELGYLTPTKDGKRNVPAGYFVDLATWQRINLLYTAKAKIDLRQMRYEARRPDLVERLIDVVDHRFGHALAQMVERAKIALTDRPAASVDVDLTGARFSAAITRKGLEETIRDDVERVTATVSRTIADAGLKPEDITAVFLTGGSTAIPLARWSILSLVPDAAVVEGDVFGSVGLGLALDANRKFG
jgi:hypothetical chaperone protein